ncbi:MAG: 5'-nucleotidase C-terminal domain-containing protein [Armatimonadota bacterium]
MARRVLLLAFLIFWPCLTGAADVVFETTLPLSSQGCGRGETALGNLVADAVRYAARSEVGFVHAELLKEVSLPVGPVREAELRRVLVVPQDEIVVLRLTGQQLRQALERSVRIYPARNQGMLQMSGVTAVFDPSKPEGSRVTELRVNGAPVADDRTYTVAMPSLLAGGAQGYHRIWEKAPRLQDRKYGTISDALVEYAKTRGTLSYRVDGRLREVHR